MSNVLHINMDKKCTKCGEGGATPSGICLECAGHLISKGGTMKIDKTIKKCGELTAGMMNDYKDDIIEALRHLEHETDDEGTPKLNVSFGFVLEPKPDRSFSLTATMSFTAKKVKDKAVAFVDESQQDMFEDGDND